MSKKQVQGFKFIIDQYHKTEDMQELFKKIKDAQASENFTYADMMLKKATLISEKMTYQLRKQCINTIVDKKLKNELLCRNEEIAKLDMQVCDNGIIRLDLPPLMNCRLIENSSKKDTYINLFNDIFYGKIKKFMQENQVKKYDKKVTLCIVNVVKENTPKSWIPDVDNHEYKNLINVMKQFFIKDDSLDYLSLRFDTIIGEDNKTVAFLIPEDKELNLVNSLMNDSNKIIPIKRNNKKVA